MGVVSDELEEQASAGTSVKNALADVDLDGPQEYNRSLVPNNGSLRVAIPPKTWRPAGHTFESPGDVTMYHFEDIDMILMDLDP